MLGTDPSAVEAALQRAPTGTWTTRPTRSAAQGVDLEDIAQPRACLARVQAIQQSWGPVDAASRE